MAISTVSYTKTPQANADNFALTESNFDNGATFLLDVMANDLGGNGKKLYSLDDGNNALKDLLTQDPNFSTAWESTSAGNLIRINNGKVEFKVTQDINALRASEHVSDTFVYAIQMGNGTLSYTTVTLNIQGENDLASISGTASGSVTEDTVLTAQGTLTVTDADHDESHTQAVSGTTANGSFTVDADGKWVFTANNDAIQHLGAGDSLVDTFVVKSLDGTAEQTVSVVLNGTNDLASFSGDAGGAVTEDGTLTAEGVLAVADVDDGQAHAQAAAGTTANGSFTVDADGKWIFTANNDAIQHLGAGDSLVDTFVVKSLDGSAEQTVSVVLNGTNDAASFSGDTSGAVAEDGVLSTGGHLSVSDVDDGESAFQTVSDDALVGQYGSFTFNAQTGEWGYLLDNAKAQALTSATGATDSLAVRSLDGSEQLITVNIAGADEPVVNNPVDNPPVTEPVTDPVSSHVINYGRNFVNGIYVIDSKTGDTLSNDLFHFTGQVTYDGTFHYGDYLNNNVTDTYLDASAVIGKETHDVTVILVGVDHFDPATQIISNQIV